MIVLAEVIDPSSLSIVHPGPGWTLQQAEAPFVPWPAGGLVGFTGPRWGPAHSTGMALPSGRAALRIETDQRPSIVAVHLPADRDGLDASAARTRDIGVLREQLGPHAVVLGDWNEEPRTVIGIRFHWATDSGRPRATVPEGSRCFDYAATSVRASILPTVDVVDLGGAALSDHLPIRITLPTP